MVQRRKKFSFVVIAVLAVIVLMGAFFIVGCNVTDGVDNNYLASPGEEDEYKDKNMEETINLLLTNIMAKAPDQLSANPYDYLKDSDDFNKLVSLGNPASDVMFRIFAQSNEDGLKEFLMACACAKILGNYDEHIGLGIASGREWFYKYGTLYGMHAKDADFHQVDVDYDLFKDTSARPELVLPDHTDMKNIEAVIANSILTMNRKSYHMGEKALEAHKIYRTVEKDGIINVYLMINFNWFGFENDMFTVVSGVSGEPARIQLKKHETGAYEVLEYRQPIDGGKFRESIREMFPPDLAEVIIEGDGETRQELWDLQVKKAGQYLEEIGRRETPVTSRVVRETLDYKTARAINLVTIMRYGFPDWPGTREILVRTGGPSPGIDIRGVLETDCIATGEDQYLITLTRTWKATINGIQPVSYWKYNVTGEQVTLLEAYDEDESLIRIIK